MTPDKVSRFDLLMMARVPGSFLLALYALVIAGIVVLSRHAAAFDAWSIW